MPNTHQMLECRVDMWDTEYEEGTPILAEALPYTGNGIRIPAALVDLGPIIRIPVTNFSNNPQVIE